MVDVDTVRRKVRLFTEEDLAAVRAIEREAFPEQRPTPLHEMLGHGGLARYLVAVACKPPQQGRGLLGLLNCARRPQQEVVGYLGMWLPAQEAHIVAVAVARPWRGQGFGELLIMCALDLAASLGKREAVLECRVSNGVAIALYEKYGFQKVTIRPRYYSDNHEDAYVMVREGLDGLAFRQFLEEMKANYGKRWGPWEGLIATEVGAHDSTKGGSG
jgi:ribosomal-protein-alanine N-acetyltransferase